MPRRFVWLLAIRNPQSTIGNRNNHLPNILSLRHKAEGINRAAGVESRELERPVVAGFKVLHHFSEQIPDIVVALAQHAIEIDCEIRKVVLEWQQADHSVLINVGLTD